jgi:multidrug efflux pump subunit AcrA (membrane-fusion protein)
MDALSGILLALLLATLAGGTVIFVKYRRVRVRYEPLIDVEAEVKKARSALEKLVSERDRIAAEDAARREKLDAEAAALREKLNAEDTARREKLAGEYASAKALYDRLRQELSLVEENVEDVSVGLYKPHFHFDTSEEYKQKLNEVCEAKKAMVRAGKAAVCPVSWQVGGSTREGQRMSKQLTKVMLRAFNGECDAAVAKVSWNNVTRMEERLGKSFEAINSLGTVVQVSITPEYLELALAELRLTHEHEAKKQEEKEEQRQIREQMREEERAQKEIERAQQEAAAEQARYEKALEKARSEMEKAKGEQVKKMDAKIADLEQKLTEAQQKAQRATSMAELTKSGHVYVISNIGSFGEDVFKIGMTRRLEPTDRVRELGDASVPFEFDIHAMIYSEDAPSLENAFHKQFAERRLNLVNMRKEFFNVTLDEVAQFAASQGLGVKLTKLAEAREYRETLAIREKRSVATPPQPQEAEAFPDRLLG